MHGLKSWASPTWCHIGFGVSSTSIYDVWIAYVF